MKADTPRLLKLDPLSALLVLVNESKGLRLNPQQIAVSRIETLEGTLTRATLKAFTPTTGLTQKLYEGELRFRYQRLVLADVLGDTLTVELPLPATVADILSYLTQITGIVFDQEDFADDRVLGNPYRLKAQPGSLRWTGEILVYLKHSSDPIELATVIVNADLNGLTLSNRPLREVITTTVMAGFTPVT